MKVVQRAGLIALGSYVQAVEAVLIEDVLVATLLQQHLANLNIAIKRRKMQRRELLLPRLTVDPLPDDVFALKGGHIVYSPVCQLQQLPDDDGLVLVGGLVEQSKPILILYMPHLKPCRSLINRRLQRLDHLVLLLKLLFLLGLQVHSHGALGQGAVIAALVYGDFTLK